MSLSSVPVSKPALNHLAGVKLGWTLSELANSLSVSVPFLRLEVKRGRLRAAHLGRRVVVLDTEVRRYLDKASGDEIRPDQHLASIESRR